MKRISFKVINLFECQYVTAVLPTIFDHIAISWLLFLTLDLIRNISSWRW